MNKIALGLAVAIAALLVSPKPAAAKVPIIYQTGEDAFECGPLPAPYDADPELAGFYAGYRCDIKGVFWSYFSVSNCKAAALKGDTYLDDAELVAAITAKYPQSSMKRGLWNHYGWMLMAGIIVIGILLLIKDKITSGKDEPTPPVNE